MRTVLAVTIALALGAPAAASAAGSGTPSDLTNMVAAYNSIQAVRVVERFDNGAVATVDVLPAGQLRVASTGNPDPVLVVKLATQPAPNVNAPAGTYTVKSLGKKKMDSVPVTGYSIASADGTYTETVWFNQQNLPVTANVQTEGHKITVKYGDYNNSMLLGAR